MGDIVIYTDGACSGNPGPGGWAAIIALPDGFVRELGGGNPQTTNNRMEIGAAIAALNAVGERLEPVLLYTDSTYVISGITQWILGWKRKGWLSSTGEPVANRDLWERLDELAQARKGRLEWRYVRGHNGSEGNERCDAIAVAFSKRKPIDLYEGPLQGYAVSLLPPKPEPVKRRDPGSRPAKKAGGVYLSYLDGKLERHTTWAECEARVKGRPARFKKVSGPDEEAAALRSWGLA